ncbi:hypothetical protein BC937DRAFT_95109, partial [Endogone sp. FLAS-F59071]
ALSVLANGSREPLLADIKDRRPLAHYLHLHQPSITIMDKLKNIFGGKKKTTDKYTQPTSASTGASAEPAAEAHSSLEQVHRAEELERWDRMGNEEQKELAQENAKKVADIVEQSIGEGGIHAEQ